MGERINYWGVPIDNLGMAQAGQKAGRLMKGGDGPHHLVTLTVGMFNEAVRNQAFVEVLNAASLVIPESTGLQVRSLVLGPRVQRVPGLLLAGRLVEECAKQKGEVLLLGAGCESRTKAMEVLRERYPDLKMSQIEGDYDFDNDSGRIANQVAKLAPDLVIMAGKEIAAERWINRYLIIPRVELGLVANFGQFIDCVAGERVMPPGIIHKCGLHWVMRLVTESPERRRQAVRVLFSFGIITARDAWQRMDSL